jgi:hypothetical protein
MTKLIRKSVLVFIVGLSSLFFSVGASAQEWPMQPGDLWEVTAIHVKDGGGYKYASWLASEWRENLEFAKSNGWIKGYKILSNVHARKGEPDLYLVRIMENMATVEEGAKRREAYMAWKKKSVEQMQSESGNRAEYREVGSESLLRELKFRD